MKQCSLYQSALPTKFNLRVKTMILLCQELRHFILNW